MINLDYQSRTPIYEQIIKQIEKYVALGILKPKEQIPSIREMAGNLGINPNTVKKAYLELENKGVIQTFSTKGTFISDNIDEIKKIFLKSLEGIKDDDYEVFFEILDNVEVNIIEAANELMSDEKLVAYIKREDTVVAIVGYKH